MKKGGNNYMIQTKSIIESLKARDTELKQAKKLARKMAEKPIEGKLRISHNQGSVQYYKVSNTGNKLGKYIKKKDFKQVYDLAQKDYAQKLTASIDEERKIITDLIKGLELISEPNTYNGSMKSISANIIYSKLHKDRQKLISPILISDLEYATIWEQSEYNTNVYKDEEKVYPTKKGDMVRSKSEVMLANLYYEMGIPYRYEAELILKNGKKVYPDFTLLNVDTRQELYHEHMGLLDDDEYRFHNFRKIDEYRKNGIFSGKNLFITFEAAGCPLNIKNIEENIRWILGCSVDNK